MDFVTLTDQMDETEKYRDRDHLGGAWDDKGLSGTFCRLTNRQVPTKVPTIILDELAVPAGVDGFCAPGLHSLGHVYSCALSLSLLPPLSSRISL